jgi:hypothetical protein
MQPETATAQEGNGMSRFTVGTPVEFRDEGESEYGTVVEVVPTEVTTESDQLYRIAWDDGYPESLMNEYELRPIS